MCIYSFTVISTTNYLLPLVWWHDGATGIALDLRSIGCRFKSYSGATLRNNLGQVVHTYVPLSPSSITWYPPKGGDALRLAECNGSLPPAGWFTVTCGLTSCKPGSAPGPVFGIEYGKPLCFTFTCSVRFWIVFQIGWYFCIVYIMRYYGRPM